MSKDNKKQYVERNSEKKERSTKVEDLKFGFKPYTVVLTCGPSGVGKSHLIKALTRKIDAFNNKEENTAKIKYSILSSDQFRYNLLQESSETLNKLDERMQQVSRQAFSLLENQLQNLISYPVNQHLIFVDSTGLNKSWREKIIQLCYSKQYYVDLMLFDYKDRKDFHRFSTDKYLTEKGVKRLYEDVIPTLEKHSYRNVARVTKHIEESEINENLLFDEISYKELSKFEAKRVELESADDVYVVGDVHGCFFTLCKMLQEIYQAPVNLTDFKITTTEETKNRRVILGGDVIDKGPFSKDVIKLILANEDLISVILGNHENFVSRCHVDPEGHVKGVPQYVLDTYFTTIKQYEGDAEFQDLIKALISRSYDFIKTSKFIITHAPCQEKYLGKIDKISKKEQRNISLFQADTKELVEKALEFLPKEADLNYPLHFFGHVDTVKTFRVKNKISLDSSAVCGVGLTAYRVPMNSRRKPDKIFVDTCSEDMVDNTFQKTPDHYTLFDEERIDFNSLEGKVKNRIDWLCKNKVNYISGTMSPSSQEIAEDDSVVSIESLKAGLDYYKQRGIKSVSIQPKYMGSRCNVYLQPKISDCYMVSRNGYVIRKLEKEKGSIDNFRAFFKKIKESKKVKALYKKYPDLETVILDGELLPWYSLGKGLVDFTYRPLSATITAELQELFNQGFVDEVQKKLQEYNSGVGITTLPQRMIETLNALKGLQDEGALIDSKDKLKILKESIKKFDYQVELFGGSGNVRFNPFSILKLVMKDGTEIIPDYVTSFKDISEDTSIDISLTGSEEDLQASYDSAQSFFNNCVRQELEGIVLKPILEGVNQITAKHVAPYMKVRNSEYLRLIYGYDYLDNTKKYEKLSRKKDNRNKIKVSINEFNIGVKLLKTPYNQIQLSNQKYKEMLAAMIVEEEKERGLDPRL